KNQNKGVPHAIPQSIPGVDSAALDPRNGWSSADKWQEKAESLAQLFMDNFKQYSDTEAGARLALAGPQLQKSAVEACDGGKRVALGDDGP
ncbi:hypothetical protein ACLBO7_30245, partial [Klebsiella pneumoniae]